MSDPSESTTPTPSSSIPAADPTRSSPQQHPHYLRRNEWLKHAAIEQLQFEEKATAHASESIPTIHPPSYYQHLITSTPNTEAERVEREHTLHHMAVYDVDVTAPSPARIHPEEIDIAVRWHGPLPLTKDGMLVLHDDDEVKQLKSAHSTSVTRRTSTSVHEDTSPKDGYKQGTTVTKDTIAWNLIQNKNQPSNDHDDGHASVPPELPEELDTNVYHGLTQTIVDQRQLRDGKNELQEKRPNQLLKFIGYFTDSIGLLIIAAAIISAVLKSWADFSVITALLFINAIIGFVEEAKAESAVHALQQKLALKTHVLRTGDVRVGLEGSVTAEEEDAGTSDGGAKLQVVSVKELVRGDIISLRLGDIVPADARLLGLNKQHVITGDVLMIDQSALTGESLPVEKGRGDMVYSGSTVKQGQMLAVVVQTGTRTFLGRAAHLISTTENSGHFQKVIGRIGHFLIGITLVLVIIILIVGVVGHGHSFLDELEQALVLTIAAIPVGMPTVLSVTMAVGSNQLAKKQVIVKRLTAVEEMAAVDILCSDKTGTLTLNELTLDEPFVVEGYDADELLLTAFLASESGCHDAIEECVRTTASKTLASLAGVDIASANIPGYKVLQFQPFDPISKLTRATIQKEKDGSIFCVAKGAPHVIMKLCNDSEEIKHKAEAAITGMAKRGLRALGVARSEPISDIHATGVVWHLCGLLSLLDPPRPDSAHTISECHRFGIGVKMITGDATLIAKEVSKRLGMHQNILPPSALTPTDARTESQIVRCVEKADGFAQVVPEDKYRIVETLQESGHIIAMTGDGVNDAPALKKANVGIAVHGCTDAARSAADIVLLRPGLSAIVDGIITSRQIFQRMHSYATYRITSTIHFLLFFFITILAYEFSLKPILIIMIALLNDAAVLVVAVDNARVSQKPNAWQLTHMLTLSVVLGVCLTGSSLAHYFVAKEIFGLSTEQLQTVIYLNVSSAPHFVIFSTRVREYFWSNLPSGLFVVVVAATQILAFFFCVYGVVSEAIGWRWSLAIMSISLGTFVILDFVKVMINRAWESDRVEQTVAKLIPTGKSKARLDLFARRTRIHRRVHLILNTFRFLAAVKERAKPVDVIVDTKMTLKYDKMEQEEKQAADVPKKPTIIPTSVEMAYTSSNTVVSTSV